MKKIISSSLLMRVYFLNAVFITFCLVGFANYARAQNILVKFRFEVDAKPVKETFKIFVYIEGKSEELQRRGDSFIVPSEIRYREKVGIRFIFGKYDLYFDPIEKIDFDTDWVVGVDHKPFNKDIIDSERNYENIARIHYIKFVSKKFEGTVMTVLIKKKTNPKKPTAGL